MSVAVLFAMQICINKQQVDHQHFLPKWRKFNLNNQGLFFIRFCTFLLTSISSATHLFALFVSLLSLVWLSNAYSRFCLPYSFLFFIQLILTHVLVVYLVNRNKRTSDGERWRCSCVCECLSFCSLLFSGKKKQRTTTMLLLFKCLSRMKNDRIETREKSVHLHRHSRLLFLVVVEHKRNQWYLIRSDPKISPWIGSAVVTLTIKWNQPFFKCIRHEWQLKWLM